MICCSFYLYFGLYSSNLCIFMCTCEFDVLMFRFYLSSPTHQIFLSFNSLISVNTPRSFHILSFKPLLFLHSQYFHSIPLHSLLSLFLIPHSPLSLSVLIFNFDVSISLMMEVFPKHVTI